MAVNVLQVNINRCQVAQELLCQTAREKDIDIVLVSEQYRNLERGWFSDATSSAAIFVPTGNVSATKISGPRGEGWTWIEVRGCRFYSCYFSPNIPITEFTTLLQNLVDDVASAPGPLVVGGDFNSHAVDWGSATTSRRGRILREAMASMRLYPANVGNSLTFRRGGSGSVVDVTFADETTIGRLVNWRVLDDYSHSDHQYITFRVNGNTVPRAGTCTRNGWSVRKLESHVLLSVVKDSLDGVTLPTGPGAAEAHVDIVTRGIVEGCNAAMPRRYGKHRKSPVYWWNDTIAQARRDCFKARRQSQRHPSDVGKHESYQTARKTLRTLIRSSKARCWEELLEVVDRDPWGLPYKIVRNKLRGAVVDVLSTGDDTLVKGIIDGLFPTHPHVQPHNYPSCERDEVALFTEEELSQAVGRLTARKAPGPDGIPNEVIRAVGETHPRVLLDMYNSCLLDGIFSSQWKRQRLVLIPKPTARPEDAPSYRPLCMLNGLGKVMERLVLQRLEEFLENADSGLSPSQYGFRKHRSTLGAINHVVTTVRTAWEGTVKRSKHVIMITLDVRNAFNSARWTDILTALSGSVRAPGYLVGLVENYFSGRTLEYGDGHERVVTAGVPQGSVLGPALWNALYDGMLRVELPEGAQLVAFADDVALLVTAKDTFDLQIYGEESLRRVKRWLHTASLELAVHKTEAVFFTRRRKLKPPRLLLDDFEVPFRKSVRYLGVHVDEKLTFTEHVKKASAKAATVVTQIARLMPNIGGPKSKRRKLLCETASSTLMYGAPIWADALRVECNRKRMAGVQRTCALRVIAGYRTISEDAALVLASTIPVDLLALERKTVYEKGSAMRDKARELSYEVWKSRWRDSEKGRWTHRLISDLLPWCKRNHGNMSFHLTQFLSGHGCFGTYLHKIGKEPSPKCHHCDSTSDDDAEHTIFHCTAWADARKALADLVSLPALTVETAVETMLSSAQAWQAWERFASDVMKVKEEAERCRQRRPRQ